MLQQFSITFDDQSKQSSWIGNITPAVAIALIARSMEGIITTQAEELKKGADDATGKPTE